MLSPARRKQQSDSPSRSGLELAAIVLLLAAWGLGLYYFAGLPVAKLPAWPGWDTLDVLIRSRWTPVDGVVQVTVLVLWALWDPPRARPAEQGKRPNLAAQEPEALAGGACYRGGWIAWRYRN
jgi:hypothetical protein